MNSLIFPPLLMRDSTTISTVVKIQQNINTVKGFVVFAQQIGEIERHFFIFFSKMKVNSESTERSSTFCHQLKISVEKKS